PANRRHGPPLPLAPPPGAGSGGGEPVHVTVKLAGGKLLTAQVWLAQVGRVPLLLLDSYVEQNEPALHEVTDRLYGGGSEHRLRQELLLGVGGGRAGRAVCAITRHPGPPGVPTNAGPAGVPGLGRVPAALAAAPGSARG